METVMTLRNFDDVLLLLGRMNYSWANTETLLIHIIAGLAGVDKETAIIIFLTLNTTRARFDLVDRLSKLERVSDPTRHEILALTGEMREILKHKNHYNHSLYSFDEDGGHAKTILMRIAETKQGMKFGKSQDLDDEEIERIRGSIKKIEELNRAAWAIILKNRFPV